MATRQAGTPPWEEPRDTEVFWLRRVEGGEGSKKSAQQYRKAEAATEEDQQTKGRSEKQLRLVLSHHESEHD